MIIAESWLATIEEQFAKFKAIRNVSSMRGDLKMCKLFPNIYVLELLFNSTYDPGPSFVSWHYSDLILTWLKPAAPSSWCMTLSALLAAMMPLLLLT